MRKASYAVNIHTLTHKQHQTNFPHTIFKFIVNCVNSKLVFLSLPLRKIEECVLSPTLFNIMHLTLPTPKAPVKLTTYADDINIATANIQSYLQEIHTWTTNNLILNPDKTTCTLHTRPSVIQHATCTTKRQHHTPHEHQPKNTRNDSHLKLTYKTQTTTWGNKINNSRKLQSHTRPMLEYFSTICPPLASINYS